MTPKKRTERLSKRGGCLFRLLAVAVLLAITVAAGYWYLDFQRKHVSETFVEVERGMSSQQIAKLLADHRVIQSPSAFLLVRLLHPLAKLQAGEYRFEGEQTPWKVFRKIARGEIFFLYLTVPEGSNMFDIAKIVSTQLGTMPAGEFLRAAADPKLIHDLDPQAPTLEGYLFPSTYQLKHRTTAAQLCRMMTGEFRKHWTSLIPRGPSPDVHRVVTLASLVEKESALPSERPLVSSVFVNRLRLNMPLQCDPTTVYAALRENRYHGVIHRSDLASQNLYNTYAHPGLPPGPITNPGLSALQAALQPAGTDFLYFVAKPNGSASHHFSATLQEHEKAVLAFRQGTR